MKKTLFIKNTAYLTVSSLILRFAGIMFKIWLAAKIGAEGMGLYQLTFSVLVLATSFAQGGIPTAVTRLVTEETALGGKSGTRGIIRAALAISSAISAVSAAALLFGANFIAERLMSEPRAALSLRILGAAVLFTGFLSVFRGYFIARRKAAPNAVSGLIEQSVRILAAVGAVRLASKDTGLACAAVFAGEALAGAVSFLYLYLRYKFDFRRLPCGEKSRTATPARNIIRISLPLFAGRYLSQLLRTAENMLVPRALFRYSSDGALALFGMIKGMALPVLFFPSAVLSAVSTLLVPEMSEASVKHKKGIVRAATEEILTAGTLVGMILSAVFAAGGYKIGLLLYKSADVGFLLTALSPIVPLMYIDSLCDGLLRGLDQQNFCFRVAVGDSLARIVLILLLVGRTGIRGFIGIMYFSNLLTCALNVKRLIKISGAAPDVQKTVILPVLCAFSVTLPVKGLLDFFAANNLVYIIVLFFGSCTLYTALLSYFKCINFDRVGRMRTHKKYAAKRMSTSLTK